MNDAPIFPDRGVYFTFWEICAARRPQTLPVCAQNYTLLFLFHNKKSEIAHFRIENKNT